MLLNFSDRTRTGVFNMVWPLTKSNANIITRYFFKMTISFNKNFVVLVNTQQSNLEETYDVIKVFFEVTISFNKKFVVLVNT